MKATQRVQLDDPTLPETRNRWRILLTSLSAMVAETATFPIDLTKTRLQLLGSGTSSSATAARPTNALGVVSTIVRQEGVLGLYKGLSPAITRHLFYTPIRIVGYENLRNLVVNADDDVASIPLSFKALLSGISGVIAQVTSPLLLYLYFPL